MSSFYALWIGFGIDCLLGDPHSIPHPVEGIGWLIGVLERKLRRVFPATAQESGPPGRSCGFWWF